MGKRKRKLNAVDVLSLLLLALFLAGVLVCLGLKDTLVTYIGIRLYNVLMLMLSVLLAVAGVLVVIRLLRFLRLKRKDEEESARQAVLQKEQEALDRRKKARLSVEGAMDPAVVRSLLEKQALTRWTMYYGPISEIADQMRQMDTYQERLSHLLQNNGAETLSDTETVLNEVEQYLCKNVRNVVNFMDVADDDAAGEVGEKLKACQIANKELLTKTRDFVYALAEYLNNQGRDSDMRILETYRDTILKHLKEEPI
ncbi:MAG: hypothetical protein IJT05_00300 [Lachnospiraceae bacterium]|nr:hypothetical protein [Lachnospiraceae bacterium]